MGNQNVADEKEEYEEDDEDEDYSYSRKNDEKTRFSIDEIQADLKEYTMRIAQEYGIFINEDWILFFARNEGIEKKIEVQVHLETMKEKVHIHNS